MRKFFCSLGIVVSCFGVQDLTNNKGSFSDEEAFNKSFEQNKVKSESVSTKKIQINTNKGIDNIVFKAGETIKLFVRVDEPSLVFAVGHVFSANGDTYSYLVPLNEDKDGDELFVKKISKTNQDVLLIEGKVQAPFGRESIRISKIDDISQLPKYKFDKKYQNYVIVDKNQKVAKNSEALNIVTRAITIKKSTDQTIGTPIEAFIKIETKRD